VAVTGPSGPGRLLCPVGREGWGHLGSLHSHPHPSNFVIYIVLASSGTAFGSSVDSSISQPTAYHAAKSRCSCVLTVLCRSTEEPACDPIWISSLRCWGDRYGH
jgi:hypothetical protein